MVSQEKKSRLSKKSSRVQFGTCEVEGVSAQMDGGSVSEEFRTKHPDENPHSGIVSELKPFRPGS